MNHARLALAQRKASSSAMERPPYRYRVRKYPRAKGVVWRWWVYAGNSNDSVDSGLVAEPDREKAEAAAKEAIGRIMKTVAPGAVGHNDPGGQRSPAGPPAGRTRREG